MSRVGRARTGDSAESAVRSYAVGLVGPFAMPLVAGLRWRLGARIPLRPAAGFNMAHRDVSYVDAASKAPLCSAFHKNS